MLSRPSVEHGSARVKRARSPQPTHEREEGPDHPPESDPSARRDQRTHQAPSRGSILWSINRRNASRVPALDRRSQRRNADSGVHPRHARARMHRCDRGMEWLGHRAQACRRSGGHSPVIAPRSSRRSCFREMSFGRRSPQHPVQFSSCSILKPVATRRALIFFFALDSDPRALASLSAAGLFPVHLLRCSALG
jgi:hypothetical protein